jgi:hypothetical protein
MGTVDIKKEDGGFERRGVGLGWVGLGQADLAPTERNGTEGRRGRPDVPTSRRNGTTEGRKDGEDVPTSRRNGTAEGRNDGEDVPTSPTERRNDGRTARTSRRNDGTEWNDDRTYFFSLVLKLVECAGGGGRDAVAT